VSDRLLLDTNVLIWTLLGSKRVSPRAKRAMFRLGNSLVVSVVSVWEIVIKHQSGKLRFQESLSQILDQILYRSPWTTLPVMPEHSLALAGLPTLHTDPFDRLLIAQAEHEHLTIVTADEQIAKYKVRTLW
jgi:PIN domain nuclease of toxin-antitoxin system